MNLHDLRSARWRRKGEQSRDAPPDTDEEGDTKSEKAEDVPVAAGEPDHACEGGKEGVEGPRHCFDEAGVGSRFEDGVDDVAEDAALWYQLGGSSRRHLQGSVARCEEEERAGSFDFKVSL